MPEPSARAGACSEGISGAYNDDIKDNKFKAKATRISLPKALAKWN
jgi:hypothetical protein